MSLAPSVRRLISLPLLAATAMLAACAAEPPLIPPTELTPISSETSLRRMWRANTGDATGSRFSPFVHEDSAYVAGRAGIVTAHDRLTGKVLWKRELGYRLGSGVSGDSDRLYVSTEDGDVKALDRQTGEDLWTASASSEVLVPVSVGFGAVVVRSADGRLLALEPESGEERWSTSYTPPALTLNGYSPPLLLDGGVLVGLDDGRLVALNLASGQTIWETVLSVPSGRSEVDRLVDIDAQVRIDDSAIYVVNYQGRLARIEPGRGQIVWSVPLSSTAGLALLDDQLVVINDEDTVIGISKESGQEIWSQDALRGRRLSTPSALTATSVVVGDLEGFVHVLGTGDGRLLGRSQVTDAAIVNEAPIARDSDATVVYVQATDGTVAALRNTP